MEWVRFDFDNMVTWPQKDKKVIIRYVAKGKVRYTVETWYKTFQNRVKNDFITVHTYHSEYDEVKLYHDDQSILPLSACFITHWCYLREPLDHYWKEYKHENGNTYTDKPWFDEPSIYEKNIPSTEVDMQQLI